MSREDTLQGYIDVLHEHGPEEIPAPYLEPVLEEEQRRLSDWPSGLVYYGVNYGHLWVKGKGWQRFFPGGKARVNPETGKTWEWQQQLWAVMLTAYIFLILKARQMGLTYTCSMVALWMAQWLGCNEEHGAQIVAVVTDKMTNSKRLVRRSRKMYRQQPKWLNELSPMTNDGVTMLEFANGSSIEPFAGTEDASRAESATAVLVDEVGVIDKKGDLDEVFAGLEACADNGGRVIMWGTAKVSGAVLHGWCTDMFAGDEIDAIDFDTPDGHEHIPVFKGINEFTGCFLPWRLHADRDQTWRERKRRMYRGNLANFDREYPDEWEQAFIATGTGYFNHDRLRAQIVTVGEVWEERDQRVRLIWDNREKGLVTWVLDPYGSVVIHATFEEFVDALMLRRPFVAGIDCAGDGDGDYHAASFLQVGKVPYGKEKLKDEEIVKHRQLLTIHGHMDSDQYAEECMKAGYLCGEALLAPEANGVGHAVIKTLRRLHYPNIYTRRDAADTKGDKAQRKYGWYTTEGSKHVAYGELERLLRNDWIEIRDLYTLDEMKGVRHLGGGKLGAPEPKKDDRSDALTIAAAVAPKARVFNDRTAPTPVKQPEFSIDRILAELEEEERRDGMLGTEMQKNLTA